MDDAKAAEVKTAKTETDAKAAAKDAPDDADLKKAAEDATAAEKTATDAVAAAEKEKAEKNVTPKEEEAASKAPLIGGIIGGLVLLGVGIYCYRKKNEGAEEGGIKEDRKMFKAVIKNKSTQKQNLVWAIKIGSTPLNKMSFTKIPKNHAVNKWP